VRATAATLRFFFFSKLRIVFSCSNSQRILLIVIRQRLG
jgi:hypothetical protein